MTFRQWIRISGKWAARFQCKLVMTRVPTGVRQCLRGDHKGKCCKVRLLRLFQTRFDAVMNPLMVNKVDHSVQQCLVIQFFRVVTGNWMEKRKSLSASNMLRSRKRCDFNKCLNGVRWNEGLVPQSVIKSGKQKFHTTRFPSVVYWLKGNMVRHFWSK